MARYSHQNTESRRSQSLNLYQQQAKIVSINQQPGYKPIWRYPLLWLGISAASIILLYPFLQETQTTKVISVMATDVSDSGIANPEIPSAVCNARVDQLITGDIAINLSFSDRAEPISNQTINNSTDLSQQCQATLFSKTERPKEISKRQGTDPISVMTRIQNAIQAERSKGNQNPVVITIWLDDAEPIPGRLSYDFGKFAKEVKSIVHGHGQVAIIGVRGILREDLEARFDQDPAISLCTVKDTQECVRKTFLAARNVKP